MSAFFIVLQNLLKYTSSPRILGICTVNERKEGVLISTFNKTIALPKNYITYGSKTIKSYIFTATPSQLK